MPNQWFVTNPQPLTVSLPLHSEEWKKVCMACANMVLEGPAMRCQLASFREPDILRDGTRSETVRAERMRRLRKERSEKETLTNPKKMVYCSDAREIDGVCGPNGSKFVAGIPRDATQY